LALNVKQSLNVNNLTTVTEFYETNLQAVKRDVYCNNNYSYFTKLFSNQNTFNVQNNILNYIVTLESFATPQRLVEHYLVEKSNYSNLNFKKSLDIFFQKNILQGVNGKSSYLSLDGATSIQNKVDLFFNISNTEASNVKVNFFKNEVRLNKFLIETHFDSFKGNDWLHYLLLPENLKLLLYKWKCYVD
jgi:hypothetical protein